MKRSLLILLLTFAAAPFIFQWAGRAVLGNKNDVSDWLPANYEETKQLQWFRQHFVADQFVIISWDGCELGDKAQASKKDDPRIDRLAQALRKVTHKASDGTEFRCFKGVTTAREVINELTSPPTELKYSEAIGRLKGSLIGPDGHQTCLIATLNDPSTKKLREVLGRPVTRKLYLKKRVTTPLYQALAEAGIDKDDVRLGGPPIDNISIDEEGERTLLMLALLSGAFGLCLTWWSLRSLRMTLIVFGCGILSAVISLSSVHLCGSATDAILMSMPAMIYVLTISGAIHYINYYREAIHEGGFEGAVWRASKHAFGPAFLCSITTGIGLASLGLSDIVPIGKFGCFSALGVFTMLIVLFIVLPAIMVVWPWLPPEMTKEGKRKEEEEKERKQVSLVNQKATWRRVAMGVQRRWGWVMAGSLATIGALCLGLPQVTTSIDLLKLFQDDAQLIQDYRWFEAKLGRLVPMELVLRFPASSRQEELPPSARPSQVAKTLTFLERMEMVARLQNAIQARLGATGQDLVGATMSAVTFAPDMGTGDNGFVNNTIRYVVSEEMVEHRAQLERSGYLAIDKNNGDELWRISIRVAAFHGLDHGQLQSHLREAVEPVMATQQASLVALRSLVYHNGDLPTGSRVLIWSDKEDRDQAIDLATMFSMKRIKVDRLEQPFKMVSEKQAEILKKYDGIVVSNDVSTTQQIKLTRAGITVLGRLGPDYDEDSADATAGSLVFTGVVPIVYKAQQALLESLIQSTTWSFLTITPLMMFVCRGIAAGAVAMLPNALPVLVVFGGMGWLGFPVDIGSMMAASIALGVAVDDTIHFLAWFREDLIKSQDRRLATIAAYSRCATPTLQAALVNGLGLSVFAVSSFTPTARFGWLMLTILVAGVIAELVMLPSLLFSPLGKAFELPLARKRWIPRFHWGTAKKPAPASPMVGHTVES